MDHTQNYNLKKPGQEDFYNVDDFNENADIIDSKLKQLEDAHDKHLAERATQDKFGHIKLQEPWINLTPQNGWTTAGAGIQIAKNDLNIVTLRMNVNIGTTTEGTVIAVIPSGYRPSVRTSLQLISTTLNSITSKLIINTNGEIRIAEGSTFPVTQYHGLITYYS